MIERAVMVIGILTLLALVGQAFTTEELLEELGEVPGINIVKVNDTAWMLIIEPTGNLGVAPCEPATFSGDCNRVSGCERYGTCCPNPCKNCANRDDMSIYCKIKGCTNDRGVWCNNGGPCF